MCLHSISNVSGPVEAKPRKISLGVGSTRLAENPAAYPRNYWVRPLLDIQERLNLILTMYLITGFSSDNFLLGDLLTLQIYSLLMGQWRLDSKTLLYLYQQLLLVASIVRLDVF